MNAIVSGLEGSELFRERSRSGCKRFLGRDCHWIADSVNWTCLGTSGTFQVFARLTFRNARAEIWTEPKSYGLLARREVDLTLVVRPHLSRQELSQRWGFHPLRNSPRICFRLMHSRPQSAFLLGQDLRVWKSIKLRATLLTKNGLFR